MQSGKNIKVNRMDDPKLTAHLNHSIWENPIPVPDRVFGKLREDSGQESTLRDEIFMLTALVLWKKEKEKQNAGLMIHKGRLNEQYPFPVSVQQVQLVTVTVVTHQGTV